MTFLLECTVERETNSRSDGGQQATTKDLFFFWNFKASYYWDPHFQLFQLHFHTVLAGALYGFLSNCAAMLTEAVTPIVLRRPLCVWGLGPAKGEPCGGGGRGGGSRLLLLTTPPCCTLDTLLFQEKKKGHTAAHQVQLAIYYIQTKANDYFLKGPKHKINITSFTKGIWYGFNKY